jgi:hypothetical protein
MTTLKISFDRQTRHDDSIMLVIYDHDVDESNPIGSVVVPSDQVETWENHLKLLNQTQKPETA